MAEINVDRKGGTSIWPWIIGLVVVAVLIWILAGMFGGEEVVETEAVQEVGTIPAPGPVGYLVRT